MKMKKESQDFGCMEMGGGGGTRQKMTRRGALPCRHFHKHTKLKEMPTFEFSHIFTIHLFIWTICC